MLTLVAVGEELSIVKVACAFRAPKAAVIVVVPGATAVARPVNGLMVAAPVLPLVQPSEGTSGLVGTGVCESVVVPLPSCAAPLLPQHFTVPSESRAQLCQPPAATAVAPLKPVR